MPDNLLTTTTEVDPAVNLFYQRTLLQPPQPEYIHTKFATPYSISRKSGNTMKFRRYSRLSAATTAITEGITPSGEQLVKTDITATVSQYGSYVTITDIVDLTVEDPTITIAVDRQNDQMNNTNDQLARDYLAQSASSTTASNGSPTATLLNRTDIEGVIGTLRGQDAKFITSVIPAATGQGTSPIRPAFVVLTDTDLEDDLEDVSTFRSTTNYPAQQPIMDNEWGSTGNARWITSTQGYVSGSNYTSIFLAKEAYGMIDINGGNAQAIIKAFGSSGSADPLDQRTTTGWKMQQVFRILQDLFVHGLVSTNG